MAVCQLVRIVISNILWLTWDAVRFFFDFNLNFLWFKANLVTFKLKSYNSKLVPETKCQSNECWCISAGGNTCGDPSYLEACAPDQCSDRNECQGFGHWCDDSGSTT